MSAAVSVAARLLRGGDATVTAQEAKMVDGGDNPPDPRVGRPLVDEAGLATDGQIRGQQALQQDANLHARDPTLLHHPLVLDHHSLRHSNASRFPM